MSYRRRHVSHAFDQVDVGELPAGHVHRQADGDARLAPAGQLGAALVQDEVGDLRDQAHLLGDPDELLRRDEPLLRVVPAAEGLDVRDLPGLDVPDRLVHQAELRPGLERVREEAAEHEPALHALVVLDRVHLHRAAALLGHVHGDVGPLQQQRRVVAVLGCHGDAGAGGDGQREAVHFDRTLHLDVELVHNLDRPLRIGHVGDDEGELVAAEAGHGGAARRRPAAGARRSRTGAGHRWRDRACRSRP